MKHCLDNKTIVSKCINAHGKKYDYSLVDYKNSKTKIKIKCNICLNIFEQLPYNHYGAKRGCPKCYNIKSRRIQQLSLNDFILKSKNIHGEKYDYSLVHYINNRTKVEIKCNKCCNVFRQAPMHHFVGNGCPDCWHESYTSKPEIEFLNVLNIKIRQKNIGGYIVDGIKDNIIYEFLGDFWHGNLEKYNPRRKNAILKKTFQSLHKKTLRRFKNLSQMGYQIKYIWESDWNKYKRGNVVIPNIREYNCIVSNTYKKEVGTKNECSLRSS